MEMLTVCPAPAKIETEPEAKPEEKTIVAQKKTKTPKKKTPVKKE